MFKLERLNVVKIVETERQKTDLLKKGFIEVIQKIETEIKTIEQELTKGKAK